MYSIRKFLPLFVIITLVLIFFNKTLFGLEIFATPDYGASDILHTEYPSKFFISQSLKNGALPLWSPNIATGFPQIAVPAGTFNPINLALFYFLPMPLAFNFGYATIFLTTGIFTYLFCKAIKLSTVSSLLGTISFSFSGIFATQISHFSVIQTLSFFPVELYFAELFLQKKKVYLASLFAIAIGLQLLTGFFQIVLYSLIFIGAYTILRIFYLQKFKSYLNPIIILIAAVVIGFLIAAVQLLPSIEFTKISTRSEGISKEDIKLYPYPVKHLAAFISPYVFGDPRNGTYPHFSENWGIFWENTGYLGILPLILAIAAIIWGRKKYRLIFVLSILTLITLLLMLGKNSPTFFLFQFPPLSFFRVPARWIMFFAFSLSILSAFGLETVLDRLKKKIKSPHLNFIGPLLITIATIDLFYFSINYSLRVSASWLNPPETANFLNKDKSFFRIYNLDNKIIWNNQFLKKGWKSETENYLAFLNSLDPNINLLYGINHANLYAIIESQRNSITNAIKELGISPEKNALTIENASRNMLDLQNVKYIISPYKIDSRDITSVFQTHSDPSYMIYENKTANPRVSIVKDWQIAKTPQEHFQILSSENFSPSKTVILENSPNKTLQFSTAEAKITKYQNQEVIIDAKLDGTGILILADSLHPAWNAYIDGQKTPILPANIDQRAILLNPGNHEIRFAFESQSFKKGLILTSLSTLSLSLALAISLSKEKMRRKS